MKVPRFSRGRFGLGIIIAGILASGLGLCFRRAGEPDHQGRRLTKWLGDCSVYPASGFGEIPRAFNPRVPAARHAVKEIGTNAIPVLLEMLQAGDSTSELKIRLNSLLDRQSIIRGRFRPGYDHRNLAIFGFEILGANGAPAVPKLIGLIGLLNCDNPMARCDVIWALGRIGPAAKDAVPSLLAHLRDRSASVRNAVTNVIKQIDPEGAGKAWTE
jgi:hypothetical protein